jgi:hypothetical protein
MNEFYNFAEFSRSEFTITETELKLIAAAAIIGERENLGKGIIYLLQLECPIHCTGTQRVDFV